MTPAPGIGDRFGDWVLEAPLGAGAFGTTFRARDNIGRIAAIKFLAAPPGDELRALARLSHPAIPTMFEAAGSPRPYIAMELAGGRPLRRMLRHGRAPESAALQIVAVLADALAEVHRAGLFHGDLKPENVHVERIGELGIWIVDFGAAGDGRAGTLHYAAPERLQDNIATAAVDVYALGLMLFELLHGHLPGFDGDVSTALQRRRTERPAIRFATPWAADLIGTMLEPNPALRPTASEVADTLEAHGYRLPAPTGAMLRRRARVVSVPGPGLDEFVARWIQDGGCAGIIGEHGTGRSHALRNAATEVQAQGLLWLRLGASAIPWQVARDALGDPRLPGAPVSLPMEPDSGLRARLAAEAIAERAGGPLYVLVDDLDQADPTAIDTLASLSRLPGVHVLCTSVAPLPFATRCHTLAAMGEPQLGQLVADVLGDPSPVADIVAPLLATVGGCPGRVIDCLAEACDQGLLQRRARRWHLSARAFEDLLANQCRGDVARIRMSSQEVTNLGALIAIFGGPVPKEQLAALAPLPRVRFGVALQELVEHNLVCVNGAMVQVTGPRSAAALEAAASNTRDLHARVLSVADTLQFAPLRVVHHLVHAQDPELTEARAEQALADGMLQDPEYAARLALQLWRATPVVRVGGAVLEALLAGESPAAVQEIGDSLLSHPHPPRAAWLAMARYYVHVAERPADALPLLDCVAAHDGALVQLDASLLRAQAYFQMGCHEDAITVARSACEVLPGPSPREQDAWVTLHGTWAQATHSLGDVTAAIAIIEAMPEGVAAGRPCHAVLKGILGRLFWYANRVREAAETLDAGASDPLLPTLQRARMLNNAGVASYSCGDRKAALERWERTLVLFERLGASLELIRIRNNLCVGYTEAGRWERARAAGMAGYEEAVARNNHLYSAMCAGNLGDLFAAQDDLATARSWYRTAQTLADAHDLASERVELARRQADVAVREAAADAFERAQAAKELAEAAGEEVEALRASLLMLVCEARQAPSAQVGEQIEAVLDAFRDKGLSGHLAEARAWAAEAFLELGEARSALKRIDAVATYAVEHGHGPLRRRAEALRDRAQALVQTDPQSGHFERMLELATGVAREQDPERLLDAIAAAGLELLDGDRCFVLLTEGKNVRVVRAVCRPGLSVQVDAQPSRSIVEQVIAQRRPVIANDLMERNDLREARSVALLALRSAMCVPMTDGDTLLGLLYVDSKRASEQELGAVAHLMRALASHAAVAIGHARHTEALERRAAHAAELVHDLRSPLAAAVSLLEEMRDDAVGLREDTARHEEAIALMRKTMSLAEQVLKGDDQGTEIPLEVGTRLQELGQALDRLAQRSGKSVDLRVQTTARIVANPDAFDRVVTNLVSNALRFIPSGGTVEIGAGLTANGVQIEISDNGSGIPAHLLGTLFERGVKDSGARGGHGLGLAIVARLVREMGGVVRASNNPDRGARFTIIVPALAGRVVGAKTG